jgi:4-hydroxy-4-methyl-2-oxoglutarate aldolase
MKNNQNFSLPELSRLFLQNLPNDIAAATVYEAVGRCGDMSPAIKSMVQGGRIIGCAFTVHAPAGETLGVMKAIEVAPVGSVLVVAMDAPDESTVWGGTSTLRAMKRGLQGLVTNACVRDIAQIRDLAWPVFAKGVRLRGTSKTHPAILGGVIQIGGCTVHTGDFIVADDDGVLVIPSINGKELEQKIWERYKTEQEVDKRVIEGASLLNLHRNR